MLGGTAYLAGHPDQRPCPRSRSRARVYSNRFLVCGSRHRQRSSTAHRCGGPHTNALPGDSDLHRAQQPDLHPASVPYQGDNI
jgi:hypothetical protein